MEFKIEIDKVFCKDCIFVGNIYEAEKEVACLHRASTTILYSPISGPFHKYDKCLDRNKTFDCPDYKERK